VLESIGGDMLAVSQADPSRPSLQPSLYQLFIQIISACLNHWPEMVHFSLRLELTRLGLWSGLAMLSSLDL